MTEPLTPAQLQVGPIPIAGSIGATVVNAARSEIGVTYAWGGGTKDGPSKGIHDGGVADSYGDYDKIGFDCSGLALYAWGKAGVNLPHYSGDQYAVSTPIPDSARQAGDLVFWGTPIHHVAIWTGQNNTIVEAYESGTTVRETSMRQGGDYVGAARPNGGSISSLLGAATGGNTTNGISGISQYVGYAVIGLVAIIAVVIILTQGSSDA